MTPEDQKIDDSYMEPEYDDFDDDYEQPTCNVCHGSGIDIWTGIEECEYCDGMGYKWWQ
jgi:RecJ-like exonuclease